MAKLFYFLYVYYCFLTKKVNSSCRCQVRFKENVLKNQRDQPTFVGIR